MMPIRLVLLGALVALVVGACAAGNPPSTASPAPSASLSASAAPTATVLPSDAPTPTPTASPAATTAVAPAPPAGAKVTYTGSDRHNTGYDTDMTIKVSWNEASPKGVTIRVFGVTACLPRSNKDHSACLVKGTPLPDGIRKLLAKAPASKGSVSWTWPNWEDAGGAVMTHGSTQYWALVVAAYNPAGHSRFVILDTGEFCPTCTY
jgi:hypothetical protein